MSPRSQGSTSSYLLKIGTLSYEFKVRSIFGEESVCDLFKYKIVFGVAEPDLKPDDVLNKPVSLSIVVAEGNEEDHHPDDSNVARYFNGICTKFEHQTDGIDQSYYEIVVRPLVWRLTRRANCRIFQQKKAVDIIKEILMDAGIPSDRFDFKTDAGAYNIRDYCVQYMMTDWDFIQMLIEQEGIYYYFKHLKMGDVLVFGDRSEGYDFIVGDTSIPFVEPSGANKDGDHVRDFKLRHEVHSGRFTIRDMEFTKPVPAIEAYREDKTYKSLEIYEYPSIFSSGDKREAAQAKVIAERRLDALQATVVNGSGLSNCRRLIPGATFKLVDHPTTSRNIEYMILSLDIEGVQPQAGDREASADPDEAKQLYSAKFKCIPHKTVFRPLPSIEKTRIYGAQTAIVVGPSGEEIYTDEYGRVKVQFHWDQKGEFNDKSSCWVRVNQNSAGNEYGSMHIPRVGWEVLVSFLEGDPDQPIIVGCLYNGDHKPPYALPDNKNISGIKTSSSLGNDGANELTFDDTAGSEKIFFHAQKDFHHRVLNDQMVAIENDSHELIMNNSNTQVDGSHSVKIKVDEIFDIGGAHSLKIGGDELMDVGGNEKKKVGMNYHLKSGMQIVLETGMMLSLKAGSGQIVLDASGVTIKGALVTIDGGLVKINSGPGSPAGATQPPTTKTPTAPVEPGTVKIGSDVTYNQAPTKSTKSSASTDSAAGTVKIGQHKAVAGGGQSKSGGQTQSGGQTKSGSGAGNSAQSKSSQDGGESKNPPPDNMSHPDQNQSIDPNAGQQASKSPGASDPNKPGAGQTKGQPNQSHPDQNQSYDPNAGQQASKSPGGQSKGEPNQSHPDQNQSYDPNAGQQASKSPGASDPNKPSGGQSKSGPSGSSGIM